MNPEIEVSSPWFELIRDGRKPVEGRKGTPRWLAIKPGMICIIVNPITKERFAVTCTGVNRYTSLRAYLVTEGVERALPGVLEELTPEGGDYDDAIERGIGIYSQWSTQEEINEYGFLGIQLSHH